MRPGPRPDHGAGVLGRRLFLGDGTRRMVDLALFPVRDDDGTPLYLIPTGLDITDALAAQRERDERAAVEATVLRRVAEARQREIEAVRLTERRADERRDAVIDEGIDGLVEVLARAGGESPSCLCDALLAAMPADHEDDIALLVLRCGASSRPD